MSYSDADRNIYPIYHSINGYMRWSHLGVKLVLDHQYAFFYYLSCFIIYCDDLLIGDNKLPQWQRTYCLYVFIEKLFSTLVYLVSVISLFRRDSAIVKGLVMLCLKHGMIGMVTSL